MLIKTIGLGGAERHVVDLSRALIERGNSVTVVYVMLTEPNLHTELTAAGVTVHRLTERGYLGQLRQLALKLQNERPNIVHSHSPALKALARMLRPFFRFRLVSTHHNVFMRHFFAQRIMERLMHWLDDVQISCSDEVAVSVPWQTISIPNGIRLNVKVDMSKHDSLRHQFSIPEDLPVFVCVANLLEKKNHSGLIAAFASAFPGGEKARLVLYGDGHLREALENQASAAGVARGVILAGSNPIARHLAAEADVFCLVSWHEGLPLALLEAMASALPCLVSRAGAMAKVVKNEETAIIVKAENTNEIAEAMRRLASDQGLRTRLGNAGLLRVQQEFGFDQMADKIEAAYKCIDIKQ